MLMVNLFQAAEAVGEDFVDDGDGEEQGEGDGEHEENRYKRDEEEHSVCRAEGLTSTGSTWPASLVATRARVAVTPVQSSALSRTTPLSGVQISIK